MLKITDSIYNVSKLSYDSIHSSRTYHSSYTPPARIAYFLTYKPGISFSFECNEDAPLQHVYLYILNPNQLTVKAYGFEGYFIKLYQQTIVTLGSDPVTQSASLFDYAVDFERRLLNADPKLLRNVKQNLSLIYAER